MSFFLLALSCIKKITLLLKIILSHTHIIQHYGLGPLSFEQYSY